MLKINFSEGATISEHRVTWLFFIVSLFIPSEKSHIKRKYAEGG